jgi:phosphoserine phosphatase
MLTQALTRPLRLFFMRHGETDFNAAGIVQGGGIDSELNDIGRRQAEAFHAQWQHHPFEAVICTGLKRTYQTVERFVADQQKPLHRYPDLNEIGWGIAEGEKRSPEMDKLFHETTGAWKAGNIHHKIEGGESPAEVWERCNRAINDLETKFAKGGDVLICTHGRTLRIILTMLMGYGLVEMERFSHQNTALNILLRVSEGHYVVEQLNDLSHLAHLHLNHATR